MFHNTLDMIPSVVIIIESKSKQVSYVNKEMREIAGLDAAEKKIEEELKKFIYKEKFEQ